MLKLRALRRRQGHFVLPSWRILVMGDNSLTENIQMALLFFAVGGGIAVAWLVSARRWSLLRLAAHPSS